MRAVGLNSVGNPTGGATGTATAVVSADKAAIDIANAPGSVVPIFQQPYGVEAQEGPGQPGNGVDHSTAQGAITGTTSGSGKVTISDLSDNSAPRPAVTPGAATSGVRTFKGTVNFADYAPFSTGAGAVNEAIVGVTQDGGSDDAEVVNLEKQAIGSVTAVADPATIPNNGTTSKAVVTVLDTQGRPLAGAQVIEDTDRDGIWDATEESYYTDGDGQITAFGLTGTAAGKAYDFFVNVDGGDDYEPAKDFKRTVTVTSVNQTATTLTTSSADGVAFDSDEYFLGDVTAKLVDQTGAAIPNAPISYRVTFTADKPTTPPTPYPAQVGTATTDSKGVAVIPVDIKPVNGSYNVEVYRDTDGTPGPTSGDLQAAPLVLTAGDSSLVFDGAPSESAPAGTTAIFDATLKLFNGTPLAGRLVDFTYAPTADSQVAAQAAQPAGTTRTAGGARDTTDAAGKVSVAIADPAASAQQAELDNTLTGTTADNPANTTDGNDDPDETGKLDVDFAITAPPAGTTGVVVQIGSKVGNDAANPTNKPGVASDTSTVMVSGDPDGTGPKVAGPIAGIQVTLTVDNEGFFTNGNPDPAPAAGNDTGELKSLGTTVTVVTDATGGATVPAVAMERNVDFDDNGKAEAIVKATVTTTTDSEDYDFDSSNPLNGGAVELVLTPGSRPATAADPARVGDTVMYDVFTTDQFGNRVGGESVNITENGPNTSATGATSNFTSTGDVTLTAGAADSGKLTATWNAPFSEYAAATPPATGFVTVAGNRNLTDSADFAFYAIDFAASTFTLGQVGDESVPVGTRVTEKVTAVDQKGRAIGGLNVTFLRAGPSDEDSDGNSGDVTDAEGNAYYDFVGGSAGTATVSAVIRNGSTRITSLEDTVVVRRRRAGAGARAGADPIQDVIAKTKGRNNGAKNDVVTIKTNSDGRAAGAMVKLFKVVGNKTGNKKVLVAIKKIDAAGKARFVVKDENGKDKTRYFAKVAKTETTKKARSNNRGLR